MSNRQRNRMKKAFSWDRRISISSNTFGTPSLTMAYCERMYEASVKTLDRIHRKKLRRWMKYDRVRVPLRTLQPAHHGHRLPRGMVLQPSFRELNFEPLGEKLVYSMGVAK